MAFARVWSLHFTNRGCYSGIAEGQGGSGLFMCGVLGCGDITSVTEGAGLAAGAYIRDSYGKPVMTADKLGNPIIGMFGIKHHIRTVRAVQPGSTEQHRHLEARLGLQVLHHGHERPDGADEHLSRVFTKPLERLFL